MRAPRGAARIAIMGNAGSGKSTLARAFERGFGIPGLDLDSIVWEPGKVAVPRERSDVLKDLRAFCETHDGWVVEGCYAGLVGAALDYAPALIFLEPGVEACLAHCASRPWEPHKYRSKAEQDERLDFLLSWVREYYSRSDDLSLSAHQALFDGYGGPKRKVLEPVRYGTGAGLEGLLP